MISGVIERKELTEGQGAKGPWKRWCFHINGKKYSTFDNLIGDNFVQGDNVEIEGQIDGKYFNMRSMKKAGTAAPQAEQTQNYKGGDTQAKIVKMACLKAAVEFLGKDEEKIGTETILLCADQFVEWVNKNGN